MNKGWESSNLPIGTTIKIPSSVFIEPLKAEKNLLSATLVGEYPAGILVDLVFNVNSTTSLDKTRSYKVFFNWASIWCGHTNIRTEDGQAIRAYRERTMPVVEVSQQDSNE